MRWLDYNPLICANQMVPPNPDGGSGGGGTGGGGQIGTGTGTSNAASTSGVPLGENGGVLASTYYLLIPVQDVNSGNAYLAMYDLNNLNDADDGSYYTYRMEEVMPLRVPTVRRIGVEYRDVGVANVTFTLTGTNDKGVGISQSKTVRIGTSAATGLIVTLFVDMTFTGFRPQLTVSRAAAGGPLSIVSVTLIGEVEEVTL